MAEINFYLKSQKVNKSGKVPIIAQIVINYKKYRKSVGNAKPKDWNKRNQQLKTGNKLDKEYNSNIKTNQLLNEIRNMANDLFNKALLEKRNPTESEIRNLFFQSSKVDLTENNFFSIFAEFIKKSKAEKTDNTIKGYNTVKKFLDKFQTDTDYIITWDSIDAFFLDELATYMFVENSYGNGYHAKILAVLGTFLRWAKKRKYYNSDFYEEFDGKEPEKEVIFLSMEELLTLYNHDFKNDSLNHVKDVYCFSCFTGLRYSDIASLKHEHIKEDHLLKFHKKPNKFTKLPLNPFASDVLKKYKDNDSPLPVISSQNTNEYIKKCCKKIAEDQKENEGLNQKIILRKEVGSKKIEEAIPKHKAITFHTARKTFITNSLMLGIRLEALKEMGAPKKDKDLKKYIKITETFKKEQMDNSWGKVTINTKN
jgi:integrase